MFLLLKPELTRAFCTCLAKSACCSSGPHGARGRDDRKRRDLPNHREWNPFGGVRLK